MMTNITINMSTQQDDRAELLQGTIDEQWAQLETDAILRLLERRHPSTLCVQCGLSKNADNVRLLAFDPDWIKLKESEVHRIGHLRRKLTPTTVTCRRCGYVVFTGCRNVDAATYRRPYHVTQCHPGDEIAWHRGICACCPSRPPGNPHLCGVFHHAIIVDDEEQQTNGNVPANNAEDKLWVIEYSPGGNGGSCFDKASIMRNKVPIDFVRDDVYIVEYPESYDNNNVVQRAKRRRKDKGTHQRYNVLTQSCEHLARWAKTGASESFQTRHNVVQLLVFVTGIVLRLSAIGSLLLIEYILPDNPPNPKKSVSALETDPDVLMSKRELPSTDTEMLVSFVFNLLFSIFVGLMSGIQQCRRMRGTVADVGCTRSCQWPLGCRYFCFHNCGIAARVSAETLFSWILPMIAATLFQTYYDGHRGHSGLTYIYTFLVLAGAFLIGHVVGKYVGRGLEQCMDHCLCQSWHREKRDQVVRLRNAATNAIAPDPATVADGPTAGQTVNDTIIFKRNSRDSSTAFISAPDS